MANKQHKQLEQLGDSLEAEAQELWQFVKNKKEAMEICRLIAKPQKNVSAKDVRDELLRTLRSKLLRDVTIDHADLQFAIAYSRPVAIEYLDTGDREEIETITQPAVVGKIYSDEGAEYTAFQVWVGRVFPQWKCK